MNTNIGREFLSSATKRLIYYKELAEKTFEQLKDEEFHFLPRNESNSVAMIVQHMHGNMLSRWTNFLTEDGEKPWRQRDQEFLEHQYSRAAILDLWQKGWDCFLGCLKSLTEEDLLKTVHIREEGMTVLDAINRQLAHYPYHVGQILYIGKILRDKEWKSLSIPKAQPPAPGKEDENKF